jgi:Tfp pilus assembly protein PilN
MKLIKKYWKLITGAIIAIFSISVIHTNKDKIAKVFDDDSKAKNIVDDKIKQNDIAIEKIEEKIEQVKQDQVVVKKRIQKKKRKVIELEDVKKDVPVVDRTLAGAKQNILKKTERK